MALSRDPKLIVADEPTTALDVTVQAQIMELLLRLREELGFALVLVSHDLALVSDVADRVVVMYGGQIAETGVTAELVGSPRPPLHARPARQRAVAGVGGRAADPDQGGRAVPGRLPGGLPVRRPLPAARPGSAGRPHRTCWAPATHAAACHHPAVALGDVGAEAVT